MIQLHPSSFPGKCKACRHSNQETEDFSEGLIACKFGGSMKQTCTKQLKDLDFWLYEEYDQKNGTWRSADEMELILPTP